MEFRRLLRKQFDMCSARGETRHGEAVEMTRDDVKALGADGSGGAQNYYG